MASKNYLYNEVVFNKVSGRCVPCNPWPQSFFITNTLFNIDAVVVRPLTVTGLIKGVGKNFITMNYWRILWVLWRMGFFTTKASEVFSWSHFTWKFWLRRRRKDDCLYSMRIY